MKRRLRVSLQIEIARGCGLDGLALRHGDSDSSQCLSRQSLIVGFLALIKNLLVQAVRSVIRAKLLRCFCLPVESGGLVSFFFSVAGKGFEGSICLRQPASAMMKPSQTPNCIITHLAVGKLLRQRAV